VISSYLKSLPPGALGLDIGCGNGKNLDVNPNIFIIGSDRSESLIKIAASKKQQNVIVADILDLPHPTGSFDFAICIAVIHHMSSHERRVEAIKAILGLLKIRDRNSETDRLGTALFFVWALEQKTSRRGWDENSEQDVMVPWVMKSKKEDGNQSDQVYQRYYHLYRKGELEENIQQAGGNILESGYEKDNWWAIAKLSE
jgi:tRNA (uracil-5-)-methyltransferase TRM9